MLYQQHQVWCRSRSARETILHILLGCLIKKRRRKSRSRTSEVKTWRQVSAVFTVHGRTFSFPLTLTWTNPTCALTSPSEQCTMGTEGKLRRGLTVKIIWFHISHPTNAGEHFHALTEIHYCNSSEIHPEAAVSGSASQTKTETDMKQKPGLCCCEGVSGDTW